MPLDGYVGTARDATRVARFARDRNDARSAAAAAAEARGRDARDARDAAEATGPSRLVGFASASVDDEASEEFKARSVGLMTRHAFVARQEEVELEARAKRDAALAEASLRDAREREKRKAKTAKISSKLSFDDDDECDRIDVGRACDEGETLEMEAPRKKFGALGKNPDVETCFLPDKAREEAEEAERKAIAEEYAERARAMKAEVVDVTYSFYDGGRRGGGTLRVKQGDTIEQFLVKVRAALLAEGGTVNRDLKAVDAPGMMYIKEDLIIPHDLTFHELVVTKARGKSGPLFRFDARDDVRLQGNARVERQDSHPGKVILRSWYEKNKHMFPANRWEVYEPGKDYAKEGYRIS